MKTQQEERVKTFQKWWEARSASLSLEEGHHKKGERLVLSLRPEWEVEPPEVVLPKLFGSNPDDPAPVFMKRKLGEGGMGEVWSSWQGSLGREVAVKKLKRGSTFPHSCSKMLREAKITGMLEHPNIVPVHVLGLDEEGNPAFAMKQIQGVSWGDVIAGKAPLPGGLQGASVFERHIRILKQVCNAIHFAHSKGVVHRDIKPDNVMIGSFGEVYVMDWGLALSVDPAHQSWLPDFGQESGIFGTPVYMSPEMAMGQDGSTIANDIHLLGATLHEILTGAPPHEGDSLYQVLHSAVCAKPREYHPSIPEELVEICHKAMHVDPERRYASAEEFRLALAGYLTHRASRQLSMETGACLAQLLARLKSTGECAIDDLLDIYQLFGQVRFGFQQALRTWKGNKQAKQGLQEALEHMIQFELAQEHTRAAAILLTELPQPNPLLQQKIQALDIGS